MLLSACGSDDVAPSATPTLFVKWTPVRTLYGGNSYPYEHFGDCAQDYLEFYDADKARLVSFIDCQPQPLWQGTFTSTTDSLTITVGTVSRAVGYTLTNEALTLTYESDWENDGTFDLVQEIYTRN